MDVQRQPRAASTAEEETSPRNEQEERHSYLLRLWRDGSKEAWRASLQSVQTGERHMFADLESLSAFLLEQSSTPPAAQTKSVGAGW